MSKLILSRQDCLKWIQIKASYAEGGKLFNPATRREIKEGKGVYNQIDTLCKDILETKEKDCSEHTISYMFGVMKNPYIYNSETLIEALSIMLKREGIEIGNLTYKDAIHLNSILMGNIVSGVRKEFIGFTV